MRSSCSSFSHHGGFRISSRFRNKNTRSRWSQSPRAGGVKKALPLILVLACVAIACVVLLFNRSREPGQTSDAQTNPKLQWVSDLVSAETLILKLTIRLGGINESAKELLLPSSAIQSKFADTVAVSDIEGDWSETESFETIKTKSYRYSTGAMKTVSRNEFKLWEPLLNDLQSLKEAKFYFVTGEFADENPGQLISQMGFEGLGQLKSGEWAAIHGKQKVTWNADPAIANDDVSRWKIARWEQATMDVQVRPQLMFRDIFSSAIPADEQNDLLNSVQDEFIVKLANEEPLSLPFSDLEPFFQSDSATLHPAVSIVDINGDGWDDFYLMTRWHKNRLFVNQKDGTFKNLAVDYGLDIDRTSCALFADFDNDGDKDAFLGRSYSDSLLMINEGGKFVDRTEGRIKRPLPGYVTSISSADFNNDGMLDLYLSTYVSIGKTVQTVENAANFMPRKEAELMIYLLKGTSPAGIWLDRPGPPNRLLVNTGNGTFDNSEAIPDVWKNTFQSTWCDYDQDGDVDLFLSNDFAPDSFFRNDGEEGFKEVAQQTGGTAMRGYGMGVSWGDYDNDGLQDLYVSNMYSKAGKRIINTVPTDMDPRYMLVATGNRLFKNVDGAKFDLVSGEAPGQLPVTKAGWSWGGQFCDFDNDGFLDIYVASGFYTAPETVSCNIDL